LVASVFGASEFVVDEPDVFPHAVKTPRPVRDRISRRAAEFFAANNLKVFASVKEFMR
jgi:hypothetical protein